MVVAQENQQSGTSLQSIHSISRLPDLDVWAAPKPTLPIANQRILIYPLKLRVRRMVPGATLSNRKWPQPRPVSYILPLQHPVLTPLRQDIFQMQSNEIVG